MTLAPRARAKSHCHPWFSVGKWTVRKSKHVTPSGPVQVWEEKRGLEQGLFSLRLQKEASPLLVSGGTWLSLWCLTCRMGLKTLPCWPSGHRGGWDGQSGGWEGHSGSPWFGAGRRWDGCPPWKRACEPAGSMGGGGRHRTLSGQRCRPVLFPALAGQGSSVSYAQPRSPVRRARDRTQPGPAPEGCILLIPLPSEQPCLMRDSAASVSPGCSLCTHPREAGPEQRPNKSSGLFCGHKAQQGRRPVESCLPAKCCVRGERTDDPASWTVTIALRGGRERETEITFFFAASLAREPGVGRG